LAVLSQEETKKANVYLLPLASAWGRTVDCKVLFILTHCLWIIDLRKKLRIIRH